MRTAKEVVKIDQKSTKNSPYFITYIHIERYVLASLSPYTQELCLDRVGSGAPRYSVLGPVLSMQQDREKN